MLPGITLSTSITPVHFEELCQDLFQYTMTPVEKALQQSRLNNTDINESSSLVTLAVCPKIREFLTDILPFSTIEESINPDEAVVNGAAVLAAVLTGTSSVALQRRIGAVYWCWMLSPS